MEEKKEISRFKTFRKIVFRTFIVLILLLLLLGIALSLPFVQTKIAQHFTEKLNLQYGTNINIEEVEVNIFGDVQLKKVFIKDEKKDTLIYADRIITSINDANKLLDGNLIFGKMTADNLFLNVKTYKGDRDTNLDKFVAAFDDGKPASGKFLMTSDQITLKNCRFKETDYNREVPLDVDFTKINAIATDFKIKGPNVTTDIYEMSLKDHRGLFVENLKSKFTYTKSNIRLEKLELKTKESNFNGDVILKYNRKDFADFNNKVVFDVKTNSASISSNDIRYFYDEMGKNQQFSLKGKIDGTLNNFSAKKLQLVDNKNSEIKGDVTFKNLFAKKGKGEFYMKGNFQKVASSYENLTTLLPNVLGKKLPSSLKKLGQFDLAGTAEITTKSIIADFNLKTILGNVKSKLEMTNIDNIDNASYNGNIVLDQFNIGSFLNRKDVGKVSMDIDVDGKGFTEKYLNTSFSGDVKNIYYNGYNYQNIIVDGSFKKPVFKGKVNINDPNLFLDFDGIVNLNKKENIYDFHAKVDYANLNKLNFMNESVSVFKGNVVMKVTGSSINNMKGDINFSNASYQNQKDQYFFDNLNINSQFNSDNTRKLTINSDKGINGVIEGKFEYNQITKMIKNSLGSLYTNYKPDLVKKGQFLKFNFTDFNKFVEILNPKITLAENALLDGTINSDDNSFKMNFNSKSIDAFDVRLDNVQLEVDNKNPLYNTYVQLDSIKTKYYKVRDFSMINTISKDTLLFRTEFKGGNKGNDFYNLNVYHTINKENLNVIGFSKSEMMFKDFLWNINEKEDENNRIIFDKDFKNFAFENIRVSHENQSVLLNGFINGKDNKNLQLTFKEVDLNKITPDLNKFKFDGKVNGDVSIIQDNSIYQPTASIEINDFLANDNALGNLKLNIKGDESLKRFEINSTIENENFKSLSADGDLEIVNDQTLLDLNLNFEKFDLGILSKIGGDVITNIRGSVSGEARLNGDVNNIDYTGKLFVDDAGLTIPYLNTDYVIKSNSVVNVTKDKFIIRKTTISDSKFNTEGNLEGFIKHKEFGDWQLNLNIDSKRLLALNTVDHEDAAYFGTAFINGTATIVGPTNSLVINVDAQSEKGTDVKIPINDAEAVSESESIHFITPNEKINKLQTQNTIANKNYNGLQMNFDFQITKDANIEVILNRDSGHGMKGIGEGGLLFRINTLGNFNMWGDFVVEKGSYNFKYGGIIDKKFDVKKNGSIVWDGDPYKAILDLEAVYNTTANPDVLIGTESFKKKIPVNVIIGLKGTISSPEPDFTIDIPNVTSVLKSEIDTKLSDKDARQTQALYLLSTGSFLSTEGLSQSQYTNFALEKAGVLFSDLLNDPEGKLKFDLGYIQSDKTLGYQTDSRVVASITTQINDKITINGKVGVPVGGINESAIIGNVEVNYRVNEDGTLNLRVFNKENEINYIGQGIGYTQGIGVSYEVDFNTFKELVNKIFTKHKLDVVKSPEKTTPVPETQEDFTINPKNNNKEKAPTEKPNQEALPKED